MLRYRVRRASSSARWRTLAGSIFRRLHTSSSELGKVRDAATPLNASITACAASTTRAAVSSRRSGESTTADTFPKRVSKMRRVAAFSFSHETPRWDATVMGTRSGSAVLTESEYPIYVDLQKRSGCRLTAAHASRGLLQSRPCREWRGRLRSGRDPRLRPAPVRRVNPSRCGQRSWPTGRRR